MHDQEIALSRERCRQQAFDLGSLPAHVACEICERDLIIKERGRFRSAERNNLNADKSYTTSTAAGARAAPQILHGSYSWSRCSPVC